MSQPGLRAIISLGSVSIAFAMAAVSLPFFGCSGENFADDQGVCEDDKNPCTIDKCATGATVHENAPMGALCALGTNAGKCDEKGQCVLDCAPNPATCECASSQECPASTECLAWSCDGGQCTKTPQKLGEPIAAQTANDCQMVVCAAGGTTESKPDDVDVPMAEVCYSGTCVAGTVSKMPLEVGAVCGADVCDGKGACVDCLSLAGWTACGGVNCGVKLCNGETCTGTTECKSASCADGVCCESACTGECRSCSVPGKEGICNDIDLYGEDNTYVSAATGDVVSCLAASNFACNGTGKCLKLGGSACAANDECVSGLCKVAPNMLKFCKGLAGEPCGAPQECDSNSCVNGLCQ